MAWKKLLSVFVLLGILTVTAVFADDLNPAPWRGLPGSTFALWELNTPNPNPLPDVFFNPWGMPDMHVFPGIGQAWWQEWGNRRGVWPLSGTIEITIPNQPVPNPYKDIWVQITWASQAPGTFPIVNEILTNTPAQLINQMPLGPTNEQPPAGLQWFHSTYAIRLYPNPILEVIKIDGAVMVDEIVIDTICVPEPSVIAGLTAFVGLIGLASRRKR